MAGIHWLASYPKSGNTWLRAFICNLRADRESPLGINELDSDRIASDRRWIDETLGFSSADLTWDEIEMLRPAVYRWFMARPYTGYHKVHDAWTRASDGTPLFDAGGCSGVVYVLRNPLDLAASFANHRGTDVDEAIALMGDPQAALSDMAHQLRRQTRQRLLTWSGHVRSWLDHSGLRCHVLRYEDMLARPQEVFAAAADFLGLPAEPERVARAVRHSSFAELSGQEAAGGFRERPIVAERFFRRGARGGWREELTPEQVARIVDDHGEVMARFGYLDAQGRPC